MRKRKFRIESLSFFNHTGISRHLERMAAKGWMLEKINNFGWIYRREEPQELHFAVSYYLKASEFDPEPTEGQQRYQDFCAHSGWELVCSSAQLQIFCNREADPTPIETEPALELEAIHASAKKSFLPAHILLLILALLQGLLFISNLLGDPLDLLASPAQLFTGFCWAILAALCATELICYFRWMSKAKTAAEQGIFLPPPDTSKFQTAVLAAVFAGFVYWLVSFLIVGNKLQRWVAIAMCFYMPALFLLVNGTKQLLKRRKTPKGVNRTVTILVSFVAAFAIMGGITAVILRASSDGFFAEEQEEVYEHGGMTWIVHNDVLPLTVEDLLEVEFEGYIRQHRGGESLFLGQFVMHQHPRYDAENYQDIPTLEYTLTAVKLPFLYEFCKERLIYEQEELKHLNEHSYRAEDAALWGAEEAYRLHDAVYGPTNTYLLCFERVLVEIKFDWEPDDRQKSITGEKLGGI